MGLIEQLEQMTEALTAPEVARLLKMDLSTVYRKARQGQLPAFAVGGSVRFDPQRLADYLRNKTRLGLWLTVHTVQKQGVREHITATIAERCQNG